MCIVRQKSQPDENAYLLREGLLRKQVYLITEDLLLYETVLATTRFVRERGSIVLQ